MIRYYGIYAKDIEDILRIIQQRTWIRGRVSFYLLPLSKEMFYINNFLIYYAMSFARGLYEIHDSIFSSTGYFLCGYRDENSMNNKIVEGSRKDAKTQRLIDKSSDSRIDVKV
jgi:hypothetical protein